VLLAVATGGERSGIPESSQQCQIARATSAAATPPALPDGQVPAGGEGVGVVGAQFGVGDGQAGDAFTTLSAEINRQLDPVS
jgi:hypothetical protein